MLTVSPLSFKCSQDDNEDYPSIFKAKYEKRFNSTFTMSKEHSVEKKLESENVRGFRTQNKILEMKLQRSNTLGSQMSSICGGF